MKYLKKCLSLLLILAILLEFLPLHSPTVASAEATEPRYEVRIVSFIRGEVSDLRCCELLEARIYKSTDNGQTWQVTSDVEGTPVSKLSYTWTNTSRNTDMVVFLSHDMTKVGLYGDTKEQTFRNKSSTAVGGQWAALKTPGITVSNVSRPGSALNTVFSGSAKVDVRLPDGTVINDTCESFGQPDLEKDLNNIAIGLFVGESKSMLDLLGESAIVHITCTGCSVSNVTIDNNSDCADITGRNGKYTVEGKQSGEATLSMTVSKKGCTVHTGKQADVTTKIFVFEKPKTSTTTTTLTLSKDTVDTTRCKYYISGVEGTKQSDGSILFTGLTPDTTYTVDVVASYVLEDNGTSITRYAYSYVQDTTKPVYSATVNTYLNSIKTDVSEIHGDNVDLYIKEANSTEYIYLAHTGTGTYSAGVESGTYDVYHKENDEFHKISDNHLIVANRAGSVDVHHYSVSYDPAGGAFANGQAPATENFASGKKVTAITATPSRAGHVFLGWAYGSNLISPDTTVTESITAPITLTAQWEREANVSINITIDHTYTDGNGNLITDSNNDSKNDVSISLVAREDATKPYLEVPNCDLTVTESSHSGHTLFVNGTVADNYASAGTTDITKTEYKEDATPTFTGLSGAKEYYVTVAKSGYDSTITATKQANGDWVIDVALKFMPESQNLSFELKMDDDIPTALYPDAAIVKVLYYDTVSSSWKIIAQHANGNPGVRVPITGKTGNVGSFPVWVHESGETTPYYYRIMVSAFIYKDGTIVPTTETTQDVAYFDGKFTATAGDVPDGVACGSLKGAYFDAQNDQKGTLDATITLKAYNVTFQAEGGKINGNDSAVAQDQYYIPKFDSYQPTMTGHTFLGWWYKDANGNYTEKATAEKLLTSDITLYALWDQTLEGTVQVDGTYEDNGHTMDVWEADRATQAMVILQQITSDTVNNLQIVTLPVTWSGNVGTSDSYKFTGLDPMKNYRIEVIVTNYDVVYQNSTTPTGTYEADDYQAVYTEAEPWETFVNGKLSFRPESYMQSVEVDASQIGTNHRPTSVMTQIWYTERGSGTPYKVITQHNSTGLNVGIGTDGKQDGAYETKIWNTKFNGNLYDYQAYVSDDAVINRPISIVYGPISYFDPTTGKAKNPLTVTLVPNRYNVVYDLNTDADSNTIRDDDMVVDYQAHIWSHETPITYVPTREGYVFDGWLAKETGVYADGKIPSDVAKEVTLTAQWKKASINYTVEYYYDGQLKKTETQSALFQDTINTNFDETVTYDGKTYALDYVVGQPLTIGVDVTKNVIKVYYGTDTISDEDDSTTTPDGIPDYYQAVVTFQIVNGTWDNAAAGAETAPILRVFTLYERTTGNSASWKVIDPAPVMGAPPEGTPKTGFEDVGTWTPEVPTYVTGSATYTLAYYQTSKHTINVIVENGTVTQVGQNGTDVTKSYTVEFGHGLDLQFTPDTGFALDYIVVDDTITTADGTNSPLHNGNLYSFTRVTTNHTIRVVYSPDTVGGGENGDESDGTPDKYQKKITFQVVNGTWNGTNRTDKVSYVTLKTDGKWAVGGKANLPTVPTGMQANSGYKKGTWNVSDFPTTVEGTDPLTYTHTFQPTAFMDVVYVVEHYKQQSTGIFTLEESEDKTITHVELNADENGFEEAMSSVTAEAKDYGAHYSEDTNHTGRIPSDTPIFGQELTLKLYYKLDTHTVTYDLNGGIANGTDYTAASYLCGSTAKAKEAAHRHGYVFQGWKDEDGNLYQFNDEITVDKNIKLTAQWTKQTGLSYVVRYLEEGTNRVLKQDLTVNNMTFEDVITSVNHKIDIDDYMFLSASPETLTIDTDISKNIIHLYYALDTVGGGENGDESDDIPDKYQKKITFHVVNGMWNDDTATDKVVYVTLETNGVWDENGTASLTAPAVGGKPAANFQEGQWDTVPPTTVSGTNALEFTYTYFRSMTPLVPSDTVLYIVEHYKADNGNYPTTPTDVERLPGQIGATVTAVPKDYDGYCVNPQAEGTVSSAVLKALASDSDIVTLKLYYDVDTVGGGENGDESDDIPDKYQKKITFHVVNGMWNDDTATDKVVYVTLKTNGIWDENGTASLTAPAVGGKPAANFQEGQWDTVPPTTVNGTNALEFTYTYFRSMTPLVPSNTVLYIVEHYKADNGNYPTTPTDVERLPGQIGATVTAVPKDYDGYCVNPQAEGTVSSAVLKALASDSDIVTLKLYYDVDTVGGGENGDESDDIPDKYQKKITFRVVNGMWNDDTATDKIVYVTLKTNGVWDENGTASLTAPAVGGKPAANFQRGHWNVVPPKSVSGTDEAAYTYTYEKASITPFTGGNAHIGLYCLLLLSSGGAIVALLWDRKRRAN